MRCCCYSLWQTIVSLLLFHNLWIYNLDAVVKHTHRIACDIYYLYIQAFNSNSGYCGKRLYYFISFYLAFLDRCFKLYLRFEKKNKYEKNVRPYTYILFCYLIFNVCVGVLINVLFIFMATLYVIPCLQEHDEKRKK